MTVADRIGVMDHGRLMQVAPPSSIYERPNSRWVADFIGNINLFEGRLGDDGLSVEATPAGRLRVSAGTDAAPGAVVWVAVRPEKIRISRDPPLPAPDNSVRATVVDLGYLGDTSIFKLRIPDGSLVRAAIPNIGGRDQSPPAFGDEVWLSWPAEAAIILTQIGTGPRRCLTTGPRSRET